MPKVVYPSGAAGAQGIQGVKGDTGDAGVSWGTGTGWSYEWHASDGVPLLSSGWVAGGTGTAATESMASGYTQITTVGASNTSYLYKTISAPAAYGSWELRAKIVLPGVVTTTGALGIGYTHTTANTGHNPGIVVFGNSNSVSYCNATSGVTTFSTNGNGITNFAGSSSATINLTIRCSTRSGNVGTNYAFYEVWYGPFRFAANAISTNSLPNSGSEYGTGASDRIVIGRVQNGATENTIKLYDLKIKTDGLYPEPPDFTFRNDPY